MHLVIKRYITMLLYTHIIYLIELIVSCLCWLILNSTQLFSFSSFMCLTIKHEPFLQSIIRTPYPLLKCAQPMLWS